MRYDPVAAGCKRETSNAACGRRYTKLVALALLGFAALEGAYVREREYSTHTRTASIGKSTVT